MVALMRYLHRATSDPLNCPGRIYIFLRRSLDGPAMRGLGEHDSRVFADGARFRGDSNDLQRPVSLQNV
jgi:hypothetical protein